MIDRMFIRIIRLYQRYISPGIASRCRYYPTCSQYMIDAICTHGSFKGTLMGSARILRCHPLTKGGIDYVPLKFSLLRNRNTEYQGPYTYRRTKKRGKTN